MRDVRCFSAKRIHCFQSPSGRAATQGYRRSWKPWLAAIALPMLAAVAVAQDTRNVTEPTFPPTCITVTAKLGMSSGSIYSSDDTDVQSTSESTGLQEALDACPVGEAVELEPGASTSAFLINPLTVPAGVSLIVDGGVTVFGSRDPAMYQVSGSSATCGETSTATGGCVPLLSFVGDNSGLYGYGVIDGRGFAPMLTGTNEGQQWWYLTNTLNYTTGVSQNLPDLIAASGNNFTLYKITLRNAPFYHVLWSNSSESLTDFTAWGIKIQSPWSVPNTDGIDIWGQYASVIDSTFSNGDDDVAIDAWDYPAGNITLNNLTVYGMNGLTIGSGIGKGVSNVLIENSNITSDVASLNGTTVNGMSQATMASNYGLSSYLSALPPYSNNSRGINIKTRPENGSATDVTYSNLCMKDIDYPITIAQYNGSTGSSYPTISGILYQNVHVLQPLSVLGAYEGLEFQGYASGSPNKIELNNVAIDDQGSGSASLSKITASHNTVQTVSNVYPATLNKLASTLAIYDGTALSLTDNTYTATTTESSDSLAYACPSSPFPYIVGELYLTSGSATNLQTAPVTTGSSISLTAMVQPATSQTTEYVARYAGAGNKPVIAVGAPALTQPVNFYDGSTLIGSAALTANGTIATFTVSSITAGTHTYTASYPGDSYYSALTFGSITVQATTAATTTKLTATPNPVSMAEGSVGAVAIALSTVGGANVALSATCSSPVSYVTCTPGSGSLAVGTTTTTATIAVASTIGAIRPKGNHGLEWALAGLFSVLGLRSRRRLAQFLALTVIVGLMGLTGCGSNSNMTLGSSLGQPSGSQVVTYSVSGAGATTSVLITVNIE